MPARPANWSGPAGPTPRDAFNAVVAGALGKAGPSDFELVPGRYPDAVPLTVVLAALGKSPQGQAALGKVLDELKGKTGIDVPPELRAAVLSNPAALTKAMEVTPGQLSNGIVGLNAAYQSGKMRESSGRGSVRRRSASQRNLSSICLEALPRLTPVRLAEMTIDLF